MDYNSAVRGIMKRSVTGFDLATIFPETVHLRNLITITTEWVSFLLETFQAFANTPTQPMLELNTTSKVER